MSKQQLFIDHPFSRELKPTVFVETGTFRGDVTDFAAKHFDLVYTIELSDLLFESTQQKLQHLTNVTFLHGDSGEVLPRVITELNNVTNVLFFLDAHKISDKFRKNKWGKQTASTSPLPLAKELQAISLRPNIASDYVIIDDMKHFGTSHLSPLWKDISLDSIKTHLLPRAVNDINVCGKALCLEVSNT